MTNRNVQTVLFTAELTAIFKQYVVKTVIDATFGEGGHGLLFARLGCKVLGLEWDQDMYKLGGENIQQAGLEKKVVLALGNFRDLQELAKQNGFLPADAVVMDLGLSMRQIRQSGRGFTYVGDEPLDLRISTDVPETAADIIRSRTKEELYEIFTKSIEDVDTTRFVDTLVVRRHHHPIESINSLKEVIEKVKMSDQEQTNFMRKVLQGLRSVVNQEPENLTQALQSLRPVLKSGGIAALISFHSLEDRVIKLFFKGNSSFISLGKPRKNNEFAFARSAKLRLYQKI